MRITEWTEASVRHRALIIVSQVVLTTMSYCAAFAFSFQFSVPAEASARLFLTLPYLLALRLVVSHRFRLDRGYWQHVGVQDMLRLTGAGTLGSLLFPIVLLAVNQLHGIHAAVFVLDWLMFTGLTCGTRVVARFLHERGHTSGAKPGERTFIVGAGEAGEQLVRQILRDARSRFRIVGFIDDDPAKQGRTLHEVPVLGRCDELRGLVAIHRIQHILIAVPSASAEQMHRLVELSVESGADVKMLPPFKDLVAGPIRLSQVRDVEIDDLLGRKPVTLDLCDVEPILAGKVVLVTGAGGSIGSELARQVARFHPLRIVLLDRAESPLHYTHLEVAELAPEAQVIPVLASVTNLDRLQHIFDVHRPDCVFHTAAYKHVPMLESNVIEGVWNNVFGTLRVARCAAKSGTSKFVLISTDKAVNPASVLGATKLVAERIVLDLPSLRASATDFRVVRFGNVLGSDGSVVPLFKRQLSAGGPLTVTHPEMRRYFMTIPEAVQLVLKASAQPEACGRIALLEMGTEVRILELAEQLIRLSGFVPYQDVDIVFTGLRPGEKLSEELTATNEKVDETSVSQIRVVERDGTPSHASQLAKQLRHLRDVTSRRDEAAIARALASLVPDYQPVDPLLLSQFNGSRSTRAAAVMRNGRNGHRRTATHRGVQQSTVVRNGIHMSNGHSNGASGSAQPGRAATGT